MCVCVCVCERVSVGASMCPCVCKSTHSQSFNEYTHTHTGPKLAGATSPNATKFCIRRLRLQKLSPLVATYLRCARSVARRVRGGGGADWGRGVGGGSYSTRTAKQQAE